MASIKKIEGKTGTTYKITVTAGYDHQRKRIRHHMTWVPSPGMTARQIEKEVQRQATLFEERIKDNTYVDNRIKFAAFAELYMETYANIYLKPKTQFSYAENLRVINAAIGHIKLCDLKPMHINAFYKNLHEGGLRKKHTATCKIDITAWRKEHKFTKTALATRCGLSRATLNAAAEGKPIAVDSAEKLCAVIGKPFSKLFMLNQNTAPLAPASVHYFHRTLSSILGKAVKWGYLNYNPANNAEKPSLDRKKAAYLEEEEARQLLERLNHEHITWRAVITFDLFSGLRRGELLGLRWCDVNFSDRIITVRQTANYLPGKGVYISTPKTDDSIRQLYLSTTAINLLKDYKQWQDDLQMQMGSAWNNPEDRIFISSRGNPLSPDSVTQWFTKFIKRNGFSKITLHSLRHTYASLMICDGIPLIAVSEQLGHAQASTTANIYAHALASARAMAADTFDKFSDIINTPSAS